MACGRRDFRAGQLAAAVFFAVMVERRGASNPDPDEIAASFQPPLVAGAPDRWMRAGEALEVRNLADLALEAFLIAARLDPAAPAPHEAMGRIFEYRFGDPEGASSHYRCAMRRGSTNAQMHYSMGNYASSRGEHATAARLHATAVALQPSHFEAHNNLGSALISLANAANQSHTHTVRDHFRGALDALAAAIALQPSHELPLRTAMTLAHKTCDFRYWLEHSQIVRGTFADHLRKGAQMFMPWQSSVYGLSPELMLLNARTMSQDRVRAVGGFRFPSSFLRDEGLDAEAGGDAGHRIRIGYLSCSGFQGNTTTSNFVRGLFGWHNRAVFESFCLFYGAEPFPGRPDGSPAQTQVLDDCDHVLDLVGLEVGQVAAKIANLKMALLVDLTGWTLFPCTEVTAMHPAPLQVCVCVYIYISFIGSRCALRVRCLGCAGFGALPRVRGLHGCGLRALSSVVTRASIGI
jgi:predicted O-linked N-acetylglucosamine transferase (SPINDLY family)